MNTYSILDLQFIGALLPAFSDEILSAILGASLAFLFSWILQRNAEKKQRALDLIQEYASPEFIDIRNEGGKAIRNTFTKFQKNDPDSYPSWKTLFESFNDEKKGADKKSTDDKSTDWRKISKIKHFYEKLNYLVSIKEVNQKYISGYFYGEFTHWNSRYFSKINLISTNIQEPRLDRR